MSSVHDFTAADNAGVEVPIAAYRGTVIRIVNTARTCGLTARYDGLDALQRDPCDRGPVILDFPRNRFGKQESGDATEIAAFCRLTRDVNFPHPHQVRRERSGLPGSRTIKWNVAKALVDRQGRVKGRCAPIIGPEALRKDIDTLL